jgi:hypothetical protein
MGQPQSTNNSLRCSRAAECRRPNGDRYHALWPFLRNHLWNHQSCDAKTSTFLLPPARRNRSAHPRNFVAQAETFHIPGSSFHASHHRFVQSASREAQRTMTTHSGHLTMLIIFPGLRPATTCGNRPICKSAPGDRGVGFEHAVYRGTTGRGVGS